MSKNQKWNLKDAFDSAIKGSGIEKYLNNCTCIKNIVDI